MFTSLTPLSLCVCVCVCVCVCTGVWLMEEEQGDCEVPNEFLDVR